MHLTCRTKDFPYVQYSTARLRYCGCPELDPLPQSISSTTIMPLAMPETHSGVSQNGVSLQEYPARTKQAAATVNGQLTDVMVISFSDKIMVTISQEGKLSQWVRGVCCTIGFAH